MAPVARWSLALILFVLVAQGGAQTPTSRPAITGIEHVAIYVDDLHKAADFYGGILGYPQVGPSKFQVSTLQAIELEKSPAGVQDRIAHIAFATTSAEQMRQYLATKGVAVPSRVEATAAGGHWFAATDPAGQHIEFTDATPHPAAPASKLRPASDQIIHVGFVVRDRVPEEHFYEDILGFRPYWHGGMKPDRTDWVALQVPDGTAWIEEMLGVGANPSAQELGVMNHFSLGVETIDSVTPDLKAHGWKPAGDDEKKPQMGLDGKWQFNIYDPDLTRVEYMEFRPSQKPCCSDFTAPHPHQ